MTTLDQTRSAVRAGSGATTLISNLLANVISWNDQRVTRNLLSRLTDRELDDIGLTRGEINAL